MLARQAPGFGPAGAAALALAVAAAILWPDAALSTDQCLDCHDKEAIGAGARSVHAPFGDDDCGACHADHGDEGRLVLVAEGNELCEGCHDAADAALAKAHHDVRGPRARCVSCHDPHRSREERLLVPNRHRPLAFGRCDPCHRYDGRLHKPVRELCLGCHGGEEFGRRIAHAPSRRGECLACHDPHASRERALLKARYAPGRAIDGPADVALCLGCHDRQPFFAPQVEATLFRSEGRNLHALHLGGRGAGLRQGLSCRACHEAHTSEEPRLVRRELDCGGVPCLKLDFRRSETGGRCASGCHGDQSYVFTAGKGAPPAPPPRTAPPAARATPAPAQSPLEQSLNRQCVSCHEATFRRFAKGRIHAPVRAGACTTCHLDHGPENRLILVAPEHRICARCHDLRDAAAATAHAGYPLEGSRCTECHDPHGGEGAAFIRRQRHPPFAEGDCRACHGPPAQGWRVAAANEACAQCHDDVGGKGRAHPAIAKAGCVGCHHAHASDEASLLRAPGAALCFGCHPRERFALQTVHDPVREGDCGACHDPHASGRDRLLTRSFPLEQYASPAEPGYALCWECHDDAALTDPERAADTGFADGTLNLHALHLRDRTLRNEMGTRTQPGVTCRNCHDPHATAAPRLVRRVLDCDGVPCLQIEFRKAGAGGRCLGGCHVSQSYLPASGL